MKRRSDFVDLTGLSFGRWTVISFAGKNRHGQNLWLCRCECGVRKVVRGSGKINSLSCGCLQSEVAAAIIGGINRRHGDFGSSLYGVWAAMKRRCQNPNAPEFENYGGRGIRVCQEWEGYEAFKEWALYAGYERDLTLDRIDVNGDYKPSNCRWVSMMVQQQNRRNNIWIDDHKGGIVLSELARQTGLNYGTLWRRYRRGARSIEALTKGVRKDSFCI